MFLWFLKTKSTYPKGFIGHPRVETQQARISSTLNRAGGWDKVHQLVPRTRTSRVVLHSELHCKLRHTYLGWSVTLFGRDALTELTVDPVIMFCYIRLQFVIRRGMRHIVSLWFGRIGRFAECVNMYMPYLGFIAASSHPGIKMSLRISTVLFEVRGYNLKHYEVSDFCTISVSIFSIKHLKRTKFPN